MYLGVRLLSIILVPQEANSTLVPLNVFFLVILPLKRGIGVTVLRPANTLFLTMLHFSKISPFIPSIYFRGGNSATEANFWDLSNSNSSFNCFWDNSKSLDKFENSTHKINVPSSNSAFHSSDWEFLWEQIPLFMPPNISHLVNPINQDSSSSPPNISLPQNQEIPLPTQPNILSPPNSTYQSHLNQESQNPHSNPNEIFPPIPHPENPPISESNKQSTSPPTLPPLSPRQPTFSLLSPPKIILSGGAMIQPFKFTYSRRKNPKDITNTEDSHYQEPTPESGPENNLSELDIPIAVRKGTRTCTQHPISKFLGYGHLSKSMQAFVTKLSCTEIPKNFQEAWQNSDWKKAILEEMMTLERNKTWQIVEKPKGKTTVGCRWVFTVKYKSDGTIERYKARLVAKGYTQTFGIDFQETFAPVAKINSIRVLLSLAVNLNWPLLQLDVKNAFLNGELEEEVYMEIPPGFNSGCSIDKVCRLRKSLYGLKQSPRAWFGRFTKAVLQHGYKQAHADHTLFYKRQSTGITILIVYVDDIVLTGDDVLEIQ